MKKMNGFRKILAWVLALAMVSGMISAFAEETITIKNESKTINGDVDKDLHVVVDDDAEDDSYQVIVEGDLTGELKVDKSADNKTVIVGVNGVIEGNVTVNAENGGYACASSDEDVSGNVILTAEAGSNALFYQFFEDEQAMDTNDIAGSATLTASGGGVVQLTTGDVKEITATATGANASDSDKASTVIVNADDTGAIVSNVYDGGKSEIKVKDVEVEESGQLVTGIQVNWDFYAGNGTTTINADSVKVTAGANSEHVLGMYVSNGSAVIGAEEKTTGDVTAIGADDSRSVYGIDLSESSNIIVNGNVTATGQKNVTGICYNVEKTKIVDEASITVKGDITATARSDLEKNYGARIDTLNAKVTLNSAGGKISSGGKGIYAGTYYGQVTVNANEIEGKDGEGIYAITNYSSGVTPVEENAKALVTVTATGTVTGNTAGIKTDHWTNSDGTITIAAQSDVTATGDAGSGLVLAGDGNGTTNVLVEGTLSGDTAVWLDNEKAAEITDLTVWKAESTGEGNALVAGGNNVEEETVSDFMAAINYIVKLAKGLTNDNVSTDKGNTVLVTEENNIIYGDTSDDYKYHTAKEKENVTLSFQLQEGEVFEGVYYNAEDKDTEGKVKEGANLLTVENGLTAVANAVNTFTLKMLRGGGMLLGLKTHTHDYSEFVRYEKEPTCTETGVGIYKCEYCDATITETVAVKSDNHSLADGAAKAVTCTEDGWDAYKYCTKCNYNTKVVIPAGHDFSVDVPEKAASCTEDGYSAHKECSRCHEKNSDYQVIKAKDHEFEGQFTADKETHWYACKNCDAKKDEANHIPGTPVKENEQLAKNGAVKSYEEVTYCTVCGAELSRETILGQDAIHNPNAGEADIAEYESMTGNDIDLDAIPMPMDVSSDNDDVVLEKLANCPDALKETAKQELAALKRSGYKIDCGCVAWPKSGATAACTLKLSEKDVPDGAQIFVNGAAVQAERKDGYYYFDITLPAVVLVAHK